MSELSQFIGGDGGIPIGGTAIIIDAPYNFTDLSGAEFLRAGTLKAASVDYAFLITQAPQLVVYGGPSTAGAASAAGTTPCVYGKIGSNYIESSGTGGQKYATTLGSWTACTGTFSAADVVRPAISGTTYLVLPASAAATAPKYTSDGVTFTAVGGAFGSLVAQKACCYGNSWWVTLADLAGTSGGMARINNANPSGSWTVSAAPSLSGTASGIKAIAFGGSGNWFVAVGQSASATAGKIATCTVPTSWTDRTVASGIPFAAADTVVDVIFDGAEFVLLTTSGKTYNAADPTGTWTAGGPTMDLHATNFVGTTSMGMQVVHLATDGAGVVMLICGASSAAAQRRTLGVSFDHGATWGYSQVYAPVTTNTAGNMNISYAGDKWIANLLAAPDGWVNLVTLAPDYIGLQNQVCAGQYVRIK